LVIRKSWTDTGSVLNIKVGMWCAISVTQINGPFFLETANSEKYIIQILTQFFSKPK